MMEEARLNYNSKLFMKNFHLGLLVDLETKKRFYLQRATLPSLLGSWVFFSKPTFKPIGFRKTVEFSS
jgi:hypothetical protein